MAEIINQKVRGMTKENAISYLQKIECPYRIIMIDGRPQLITADYKPGRINLSIVRNIVVEVSIG